MAAKNGGRERDNRAAGDAASAASADDERDIQRLIDGPDSGSVSGANESGGSESSGSKRESGSSGIAGDSSGTGSGSGERESGIREAGAGTADAKRTGNRSRSAGRTGAASAASEKTRTNSDAVSRQVKPPKQPKIEADAIEIPSSNKEIIGDVFQFCFWGIGQATGIPEWELEDDDAGTIGENGEKWLKSLGPKRAKNVIKMLQNVGPSVAFFGSLGMALVPRVRLTIDRAKHGAIKPPQERKTGGNSPDSATSSNPSPVGIAGNDSAAGINARPFTTQDIGEVTQGHAFENAGG